MTKLYSMAWVRRELEAFAFVHGTTLEALSGHLKNNPDAIRLRNRAIKHVRDQAPVPFSVLGNFLNRDRSTLSLMYRRHQDE
jgi:hypothetical protein